VHSDRTVLVVEDNVDTSRIIDMILESEGYRVICAKNGQQAKEFLAAETPDCIVLDIMMPEMDGFTFCSWVRTQDTFRNIPIVRLTSFSKHIYESKHSHKEALYTEADEYLEKPVKPERLLAILENLLNKEK
jgi:CheY-like chemotaxis protein